MSALKMETFRNLCPHEITLIYGDESSVTFESSDLIVRATSGVQESVYIEQPHVPCVTPQSLKEVDDYFFGFIADEVTHLIVSMPVGQVYQKHGGNGRFWILAPDTGMDSCVRDKSAKVIGVKRFVLYARPEVEEKEE